MSKDNTVRQGQVIFPWGVGAIIPLPFDKSGIVAGLEQWDNKDPAFAITDERLVQLLGIKELRMPPYYEETDDNGTDKKTIPMTLFPNWYYCPKCHRVYFKKQSGIDFNLVCNNPDKGCKDERLIPERFIVICEHGHVDNLPIFEMLHPNNSMSFDKWLEGGAVYQAHKIERKTVNAAALNSTVYTCSCGAKVSLQEILAKGALNKKFGIRCKGARPWFGDRKVSYEPNGCGEEYRVVQKGGTNVWFAKIVSSIYIPSVKNNTASAKMIALVAKWTPSIKAFGAEGNPEALKMFIKNVICVQEKVDFDEFYKAYQEQAAATPKVVSPSESSNDIAYRYEEFCALIQDYGNDRDSLYVSVKPISEYDQSFSLGQKLKSISLVHKMKETRALVGFSRVNSPDSISIQDAKKMMSLNPNIGWLPATQTNGEGIFIRFDDEKIKEWSENPLVKGRIQKIKDNLSKSKIEYLKKAGAPSASFVMIHTFTHLLINELAKSCGYGSSSIRERIYVSDDPDYLMHAVLLYTSASGSEGSLGGLVRMGKVGYLEKAIARALQEATWCSSDPICIESNGQGPDELNLAACHNCALLPETCCENGNRYLDRALLIGNPIKFEDTFGFFQDVLEKIQ